MTGRTEFDAALQRTHDGEASVADLALLLAADTPGRLDALRGAAYAVKTREVGRVVRFRGLIELGNVCSRNCRYCGIRCGNPNVERYTLDLDEIVEGARQAHAFGYGSAVLQGGERRDAAHGDFITEALERIHAATDGELGITLSLGEQSRETYRRWRAAGAHRYLLRMETTDRDLYRSLHPDHPDWEARRRCLDLLREADYQVGTGVMIGLPGQSLESLAGDVLFFRDQDIDMIGMGPYLPHEDAPLDTGEWSFDPGHQLRLGLNMIACARLLLPDANIAATTALHALHPEGREQGLLAGANVMMPNVTDTRWRSSYQLYDGKPGMEETATECRDGLENRIRAIGETIGYGERGDSPRYARR